ncbi:MAG: hypothetical protein NT169_19560 [Chloroflexi bacterium]|nr:hypothetical protein [Chloroflexota bacterium]
MRRTLVLVGLSLVIGLILLGALLLPMIRSGGATGWRAELDHYVAYRGVAVSGTVEVASVSRATRPFAFNQTMSGLTFGDTAAFQTNYAYTGMGSRGYQALPFPPTDVWCIRLTQRRSFDRGGEEVTSPIVFVARHASLYSADWVTHEPPGGASPGDLEAMMMKLDCR